MNAAPGISKGDGKGKGQDGKGKGPKAVSKEGKAKQSCMYYTCKSCTKGCKCLCLNSISKADGANSLLAPHQQEVSMCGCGDVRGPKEHWWEDWSEFVQGKGSCKKKVAKFARKSYSKR